MGLLSTSRLLYASRAQESERSALSKHGHEKSVWPDCRMDCAMAHSYLQQTS